MQKKSSKTCTPRSSRRAVKSLTSKGGPWHPGSVYMLVLGLCIGYGAALHPRSPVKVADQSPAQAIAVHFSPKGGCTQVVEQSIAEAQRSILVQAYSFTSTAIAEALVAAHARGVSVQVLVDRSQRTGRYTQIPRLTQSGIPVLIDKVPGIAHNKVMIIDQARVLTGSFNWTNAAEHRNAENLLVISDPQVSQTYEASWHMRAAKAQPLLYATKSSKKVNVAPHEKHAA